MMNSNSKPFVWLSGLTLVVWWTALGGRDAYLIPAVLMVMYAGFWVYTGCFFDCIAPIGRQGYTWVASRNGQRWWQGIMLLHGLLFLATVILKYYAFRFNTWDAGIYNNIIYNISQGRFYSSFHDAHNFSDHFTPSISFISLLYMILPSIHWMMGFKVLAYVLCPVLMYQIAKKIFDCQSQARAVSFVLGTGWLLFYAPAVQSLNYEFQSSCLAPPAILYAFLCLQRQHWLRFLLAMLFILGLKEHLGSVWVGIGGYLIFATPQKKLGVVLIGGGILALWLIPFQVMPYFRDDLPSWNMRIAPFELLPQKMLYLVKLLLPLMFLPLMHWRLGMLAAPAIGINLVSGRASMVSSNFHYDDVPSVLLFLATLLAIREVPWTSWYVQWQRQKSRQWGLILWLALVCILLPPGPLKPFSRALPNQAHWAFGSDIRHFNALFPAEPIAVQAALGPHFFREHIRDVIHTANGNCAQNNALPQIGFTVRYLILAPGLNPYLIHDMAHCIETLEQSSRYQRLPQFRHLYVYKSVNRSN